MDTDYRSLKQRLVINKHDLDGELAIQAQAQEHISSTVGALAAKVSESKMYIEQYESGLFLSIKDDDAKATVQMVESQIKTDKKRLTMMKDHIDLVEQHSMWVGLLDAWRSRGYNIKTMADLYASQYFAVSSVSSKSDDLQRMQVRDAFKRLDVNLELNPTPAVSKRRRVNVE